MTGRAHRDRTFRTYGANGVTGDYKTWAGCWVLCDGGYQHVQASPPPLAACPYINTNTYLSSSQAFINPMHDRFTKWEVFWSEWVESCRKDVECFFSIVKSQWRWLRNKVEYYDALIIEHAMHTACILHNMLLEYKEYDTFQWDAVDPEGEEDMHDEFESTSEEELIVRAYLLLYYLYIY
jgi:hypothetical protein